MKQHYLAITFCLVTSCLYAQEVTRIEVSGKLIGTDDAEGVTIFNTSSNKGTVADSQGYFILEVALNDVLEISALQYEAKTVSVNQEVISSKQLRLFLVDKVNALKEVLLLSSSLSGNLLADIDNVVAQKKMEMNFGNLSDLEFPEDEFTKVDNELVKQGQLNNGLNVASVFGLNKLINRPIKKRSLPVEEVKLEKVLAEKYTPEFFNNNFQIPLNQVEAFIRFVVLNGLTKNLLHNDQEFMFLEFLQKQSLEFKKQDDERN
ncbi:carboxypeptidase-like regulatory domain-containing protein [Bizionia arctica]|uniref:carboxypeptidase-like regulatory domain-containing protein n=1 Tax=Bizionia arctica TaxID=1495645 RepID=UPI001666CA3C|nr:carboxypeptidase-like regulatory domain-containing protein [Bizionia arctica]